MRAVAWNVRRAGTNREATWKYLFELNPDIALLQEVGSLPKLVTDHFAVVGRRARGRSDKIQSFSTPPHNRGIHLRKTYLRPAERTDVRPPWCYACSMNVASRELRNNTRALLDRVEAGEAITITVNGKPVAELKPIERRSSWITRQEFVRNVLPHRADAGLRRELADTFSETTDDLPN